MLSYLGVLNFHNLIDLAIKWENFQNGKRNKTSSSFYKKNSFYFFLIFVFSG